MVNIFGDFSSKADQTVTLMTKFDIHVINEGVLKKECKVVADNIAVFLGYMISASAQLIWTRPYIKK